AVKTSLPIHLNYHAKEIDPLRNKLLSEEYQNSVIFIAWEHDNLVKVVRDIMAQFGGDPKAIPKWESGDFDSIYILKIIKEADKKKVLFEQQHQQLNDVPKQCP
ncbi:histidine phosphatase family protein, partial [Proteus mirabilis]